MTRPLTTLALTLGTAASIASWTLVEARLALGIVIGFLAGSSLSALGALWQAHWWERDPARLMRALVEGFLAKLLVLVGGALVLRWLQAGRAADWAAFLVAFGVAVALVAPIATWEGLRRGRREARGRTA